MKLKQSFILFMSGFFFVAYFDTNLFHYARVCMLIVAFDNKILAMEACHQTSQALLRVEPEWKQEVSLHSIQTVSFPHEN